MSSTGWIAPSSAAARCNGMELLDKLAILTDAAKYDAACTSSGVRRSARPGMIGNTTSSIAGCCHSFSADGRCITLLKVLMTNSCVFDCKYCVNRRSNDTRRAAFTPRELAELTIGFYRRNYIEGLFLSSGVLRSPDYTTERMIECLRILREEYRFNGYIHAKAIPGTSPELVQQLGLLADRLSVNIELPSQKRPANAGSGQEQGAPFCGPWDRSGTGSSQSKAELVKYRHAPRSPRPDRAPRLIVGATADNDRHILHLTQALYREVPSQTGVLFRLCAGGREQPAARHRIPSPPCCGSTGCIRRTGCCGFTASGPRSCWTSSTRTSTRWWTPSATGPSAIWNSFRVEIMNAEYETLLRVPGIGPISARRIVSARRHGTLRFEDLKKLGVVLKRAQFFITCGGRMRQGLQFTAQTLQRQLEAMERGQLPPEECRQLSLFDSAG